MEVFRVKLGYLNKLNKQTSEVHYWEKSLIAKC